MVFLDDRIEVENMGILLPGMTIEEMKRGASRVRNPVIARVFKELNLIEQWGTGVRRIFSEAREKGLPEPKIEEIAMRFRFIVYLAEPHRIHANVDKQGETYVRDKSGLESGLESPAKIPTDPKGDQGIGGISQTQLYVQKLKRFASVPVTNQQLFAHPKN